MTFKGIFQGALVILIIAMAATLYGWGAEAGRSWTHQDTLAMWLGLAAVAAACSAPFSIIGGLLLAFYLWGRPRGARQAPAQTTVVDGTAYEPFAPPPVASLPGSVSSHRLSAGAMASTASYDTGRIVPYR